MRVYSEPCQVAASFLFLIISLDIITSRSSVQSALRIEQLRDQLLVVEEVRRLGQVFKRREDVAEECVVQLLLTLAVLAQEAVIIVAVLCWIYSYEISSSLIL